MGWPWSDGNILTAGSLNNIAGKNTALLNWINFNAGNVTESASATYTNGTVIYATNFTINNAVTSTFVPNGILHIYAGSVVISGTMIVKGAAGGLASNSVPGNSGSPGLFPAGGGGYSALGAGGAGGAGEYTSGGATSSGAAIDTKSLVNRVGEIFTNNPRNHLYGAMMGAGGGGGQANNSTASPGGSGGGGVIFYCDNFSVIGSVIVDGDVGGAGAGGGGGGGGAGAGGFVSVIVRTNIVGAGLVSAKGGSGSVGQGAGGGGAGGNGGLILIIKPTAITTTFTTAITSGPGAAVGGQTGTAGSVITYGWSAGSGLEL